MKYRLKLRESKTLRTHWWKPSEDYGFEITRRWMLVGPGALYPHDMVDIREATPAEIEFWEALVRVDACR